MLQNEHLIKSMTFAVEINFKYIPCYQDWILNHQKYWKLRSNIPKLQPTTKKKAKLNEFDWSSEDMKTLFFTVKNKVFGEEYTPTP